MISEIGRNQDLSGIQEGDASIAGYEKIQPESNIGQKECKAFWNDVFSSNKLVDSLDAKRENVLAEKAADGGQDAEKTEKKGGSYGEVFKEGEGDKYEVHHMPADSISYLERNDGPAIKMEKEDHRQTASCGNSRDAREYRQMQKELIEAGRFRDALQMDIDDLHDKFGDKYDDAIGEMLEYVDKLEKDGKING